MRTLQDIENLSDAHPVIDMCLKAFHSGQLSEVEALREMVCHLADNIKDLKRIAVEHQTEARMWNETAELFLNEPETPKSIGTFFDAPVDHEADKVAAEMWATVALHKIEDLFADRPQPEKPAIYKNDEPMIHAISPTPDTAPAPSETVMRIRKLDMDLEPLKKKQQRGRGWPW